MGQTDRQTNGHQFGLMPPVWRRDVINWRCCMTDYIPDACLSQISQSVGSDWRRLANQLRISVSEEKRHAAEVAVLRAWRDRHLERPSEALDKLRRALSTIGRADLLKVVDFYARDARRQSGSAQEGPKLVSTV